MKVSYHALKKIIREVAVPASAAGMQPTRNPIDNPNIAKALAALERPFMGAVQMNLILDASEGSSELDDASDDRVVSAAQAATKVMMARVHKAVQSAWAEAMKGARAADKQSVQKKVT